MNKKLKVKTEKLIDVNDWDELVVETYGRIYNFQQQDGCKSRGVFYLTVPNKADDYENTSVLEIVNEEEMGVSFKAWLERDPKQLLKDQQFDFELNLWWGRNFYPDIQMVANDLYKKGLLESGDYIINIDW